jgi:hypothetical protein
MEGNKTPARRSRRTVTAAAAPAAPKKTPAKPKSAAAQPRGKARTDVATSLSPAERLRMIEMAAYFRAERRGFAPGHDFEDWLAAEAEIAVLVPSAPSRAPVRKSRKGPAN